MGAKLVLACLSLAGLVGCNNSTSVVERENQLISTAVTASAKEGTPLVSGRLRFEEPEPTTDSLFETEFCFSVSSVAELKLILLQDEPLTPQLLQTFFEQKVKGSSAAGILLQSNEMILTFAPNSPVFHLWELSGDVTQFETLLSQIGVQYPFTPDSLTTDFFSQAFEATDVLSATLIGSGLIEGETIQFTSKKTRQGFNHRKLKKEMKETLFNREVEISEHENGLAVKVFLKDEDGFHEEWIRQASPRVLKTLKHQKDAHQFDSFSVEYLAKPSHPNHPSRHQKEKNKSEVTDALVASLELSVHELHTLPWEGQLQQTLAEPLDYFRYYGAVEYE